MNERTEQERIIKALRSDGEITRIGREAAANLIESLQASNSADELNELRAQIKEFYDTLHKYWPGTINELLEDWQRLKEASNSVAAQEPVRVHTNTDRIINMDNRQFSNEGNGYIQDNNFDFDAALQVSGDFVDDEKHQYAQMIADCLNEHAHPITSQVPELTVEHIKSIGGIVHRDGNIFITNIDKLNECIRIAAAPTLDKE